MILKKKTKITKEIYSLISSINEKINLGYFHYCSQHKTIFFKYQVSTKGTKLYDTRTNRKLFECSC